MSDQAHTRSVSEIDRVRLMDGEPSLKELNGWVETDNFPNKEVLTPYLKTLLPKVIQWYQEKFEAIQKLRDLHILSDEDFEKFKENFDKLERIQQEHKNCAAELAQARRERDARPDMTKAQLAAMRDTAQRDLAAAQQALRDMTAARDARADITPVALQDLRDQVAAAQRDLAAAQQALRDMTAARDAALLAQHNAEAQRDARPNMTQAQLDAERAAAQQALRDMTAARDAALLAQHNAEAQRDARPTQAELAAMQAARDAARAERDARPGVPAALIAYINRDAHLLIACEKATGLRLRP